jgi:DNA-binding GntR family transcriptional regulator
MADLDGPDPMYQQIAAILRDRIADGTYALMSRIPSQAEICEEFEVARPTAISAVKLLADEGLVRASVGKGTYVVKLPD